MALLQNGSLFAQYPYRRVGGDATAANAANLRPQLGVRSVSQLSPFVGGVDATSSLPLGWRFDNGWLPPMSGTAALLANLGYAYLTGAGALFASGALGKNAQASLSGSGDLSASGALIVSLLATLSGSGTISNATAAAYLQLAASLAGSGDLAGAIGALANASATLSGTGSVAATARANGALAASIVVTGTGLTTSNVGPAVWSALAAANNDPGSMGEKLNDAGSASNPWTEVLETGFTAGELLLITAAAVAGTLTRVDNGNGTFTITIRGLDGTTDRIVGIVDADGNRVSAIYDGS